jgi:aminoglycoside phosphotransferase (APT) family kinase protein
VTQQERLTETDPDYRRTVELASRHLPGFSPGGPLLRNGKAILAIGMLGGQRVLVKHPIEPDEFWRQRFLHELAIYRAFAASPPPVRVPALHLADDEAELLVVDWIEGRPIATQRYPTASPSPEALTLVLDTLGALPAWRPPAGWHPPRVYDYPARLVRYRRYGLLSKQDHELLLRLLAVPQAGRWVFQHGDPLLGNFLRTPDGELVLVDWEFAGAYLPGYDLAMLWMLLDADPAGRRRIEALIAEGGSNVQEAFLVNQAMVLTREIRKHHELPQAAWRDERVARLERDWAQLRMRIGRRVATSFRAG